MLSLLTLVLGWVPAINDDAVREWMRNEAVLPAPPPTFSITLRRLDGPLWKWERETGQWVPLCDGTKTPLQR